MALHFHDAVLPLMRPIEEVSQHPENPNNGDVDALVGIIEAIGYTVPILVQKSTGYIIAGHTRYNAVLAMGGSAIPVLEMDVDDETALRMMIGDNEAARRAWMDNQAQLAILKRLRETERDLLGTGITEPDFQYLLARAAEDIPGRKGGFVPAARHDGEEVLTTVVTCPDCGAMFNARLTDAQA